MRQASCGCCWSLKFFVVLATAYWKYLWSCLPFSWRFLSLRCYTHAHTHWLVHAGCFHQYCKSRIFSTLSIFVSWALRPFVRMKFSYSCWLLQILWLALYLSHAFYIRTAVPFGQERPVPPALLYLIKYLSTNTHSFVYILCVHVLRGDSQH